MVYRVKLPGAFLVNSSAQVVLSDVEKQFLTAVGVKILWGNFVICYGFVGEWIVILTFSEEKLACFLG